MPISGKRIENTEEFRWTLQVGKKFGGCTEVRVSWELQTATEKTEMELAPLKLQKTYLIASHIFPAKDHLYFHRKRAQLG